MGTDEQIRILTLEACRLYAIGLNQGGFEVKLAANGAEAIEGMTSGEIAGSPNPFRSKNL